MATYSDTTYLSSYQLQMATAEMRLLQEGLKKVVNDLYDYIGADLEPNWTTPGGKNAIQHLRDFVNTSIEQKIINGFVEERITGFENCIKPSQNIEQAG